MRLSFPITFTLLLFLLFSCKEDQDNVAPTIVILDPVENTEYEVLSQVVVRANVSDNEVVETVQVSLISDDTKNKVLPSSDFQVGQKEYALDFAFNLSDSLLPTGRYYFRIEAFDGENRISSFRYINIRGVNTQKTGVFVTCENGSTADLYFDRNQFSFQQIYSFGKLFQGSVFNRFNQQFWFLPRNDNEIEMYDPNRDAVTFRKSFNSNFPNAFQTIKKDERDVRFTVRDIGVRGFNQNQNENYAYLTPSTKKVESLGIGEEYDVVEEVDLNGSNRLLRVLDNNSGQSLISRTIFDDVVDLQFITNEDVLVLCNTPQGGKGMLFNAVTSVLQTNIFTCDSIREVVRTNVGDFIISTKSAIETYRPSISNLATYLNIGEAVLAYDVINNQIYVGSGTQLQVYDFRQVSPFQSTTLPNKIVGINVKLNQF